jgi:DNA repair ATPase RecN
MKKCKNILFIALITVFFFSVLMFSDTIVLKNGKKIHTSWVKVENGIVTYRYTYGTMSLKLDLVKEIIKDNTTDPKKEKIESEESSDANSDSSNENVSTSTDSSSKEKDPKAAGSFWNSEKKRLMDEKTKIEAELKDLENYRVALIRSRRSTGDITKRIEEKRQRLLDINTEMSKILDEARAYGVSEWDIDHAEDQNKEEGQNKNEGGGES